MPFEIEKERPTVSSHRVKSRRRALRALAASLLLGSCAAGAEGETEPLPPAFEPADCPQGVVDSSVRCGTFRVPLRHAEAEGPALDLYAVVLPALQPRPGLPPLLILSGGPGLPVTIEATRYAFDPQRRHRDIVLLDRRGTGGSSPLMCPEFHGHHPLQPKYPPELVRSCAQRLLAEGHDVTAFGTAEAVADIDAVRASLGYEQLDLWAISAGTRLALNYLREHPTRVRAAVLIGSVPPDSRVPLVHASAAQRALDLVFEACRRDVSCATAHPDLETEWQSLLERLEGESIPVTTRNEDGEPTWSGAIERGPFGEAFRAAMLGSTGRQLRVPAIVHAAASGDFGPFLAQLSPRSPDSPMALGLFFAVSCSEETARIDRSSIDAAVAGTFLGRHRVDVQIAGCAEWPTAEPPARIFEAVDVDVPVLLLAAERDNVTPPAWAHEIASTLPRARVVEMRHSGHQYWDWGPDSTQGRCFDELAHRFWDDPDVDRLDASCAENVEHPPMRTLEEAAAGPDLPTARVHHWDQFGLQSFPEIERTPTELGRYAGTYQEGGARARVWLEDGRLRYQTSAVEAEDLVLVPMKEHVFAVGRYREGRLHEIVWPSEVQVFYLEDDRVAGYRVFEGDRLKSDSPRVEDP